MSVVDQDPEIASADQLEALIKEARDRQRRRRRRIAVAILLAAGVGWGASGPGGGAGQPPASAAASPAAIRAFLATAQRALDGTYSAAYEVTVPDRQTRSDRRAVVSAAQRSRDRTMYRETPAFSASDGPSGTVPAWERHRYEVFASAHPGASGMFSCIQAHARSPWSCQGPYQGIGMGGTFALQGAYPPQAFMLGLQNAAATYTGQMATRPQRAFLAHRWLLGHQVRCLQFGRRRDPGGTVCINRDGVIVLYDLPPAVTSSAYVTATLQSYSTTVTPNTFSLPARPTHA